MPPVSSQDVTLTTAMIRLDTLACHDLLKGAAMSQYFDMGNETLWNPSNGAAQLFVRQVRLYEDVLGVSSGIGPMENDEC